MDRKILILVLIGVILFAPCAALAKSTGWTTYKNDECGFSIEYPKDWGKNLVSGENFTAVSFSGPKADNIAVSVQVVNVEAPKELEGKIITEKFIISGIAERQILIVKNGKMYALTFVANYDAFNKANDTYFKKMIDSFTIF